jgi:glycosyltransferase involved in cell wall biosynthesis
MNWVIPHFELGSGGHMTIFRMIWHLEQLGYSVHIAIIEPTHYKAELAQELIRKHFMPISADVSIGEDSLQPAEFTFATSWETAYTVNRFSFTRYKLYFVQDMEPYFHPAGSSYAFAEATYRFGFIGITAGNWLAQEVKKMYGMEAYPFGFSYDKEHHKPLPRQPDGSSRVFFYARSVTPRRGFELGLLALYRVHQLLPEVEFVLAGWDTSAYHIPFAHLNAGVVPHHELPGLYSQCDVALVLSMTNISLLPLELMACGCPVVSNKGPNVEWQLKDGENAVLAEPTPEDLATAIVHVLSKTELRQRLIYNGLKFAKATDWFQEGKKVYSYLEQIRNTH